MSKEASMNIKLALSYVLFWIPYIMNTNPAITMHPQIIPKVNANYDIACNMVILGQHKDLHVVEYRMVFT